MINGVTRRRVIGADAAIGVITTASFALGLALFAVFGRRGRSFDAAAVRQHPRRRPAATCGRSSPSPSGSPLVVFFGYRRLLFTTFDPEVAEASGVRTARVDALLMVVLATSILATMQVLGVTLIAATLVIPATVARMLTNSFSRMLFLATGIGAVTGFVGMNLSYHLDVQSGPDDRAGRRRPLRRRVRGDGHARAAPDGGHRGAHRRAAPHRLLPESPRCCNRVQ